MHVSVYVMYNTITKSMWILEKPLGNGQMVKFHIEDITAKVNINGF